MKTAEFGQPCVAVPQPGKCRICGSSDPDSDPGSSLNWADETRTLCDLPECIRAAKRELGLVP